MVRSLLPGKVNIMALTAIANKLTRRAVCCSLGMISPVIVCQVPNRPNIKYCVHTNAGTLEEHMPPLWRKQDLDAQEWIRLLCIVAHMIAVR